MKTCFSFILVSFLCGCVSFKKNPNVNPFTKFDASDVSKIALCYEDQIIGPEFIETDEHVIADPSQIAEFYLHPTGIAIRDKKTITVICNALRNVDFSTSNNYPMIGVLGYQVFFGNNNEVLAVTQIVNYQSTVCMNNCKMKNGWIGFVFDGSIPLTGYCSTYCRLIYELMKKELPKEIEKQDQYYRSLNKGLTLESLLFKKTP
jgi:hypothetical protein